MSKPKYKDFKLLLKCECHDYHYFEMVYDADWGFSIAFIEHPRRLQERLSVAWKALFSNDHVFDGELMIKNEDYKAVEVMMRILRAEQGIKE